MISKAKIKILNQLKQKKQREIQQIFLAEGTTNVIDFIKSGITIIDLFATQEWMQNYENSISNIPSTVVTVKELKKITSLSSPSEVLATFALPNTNFDGSIDNDNLTIALDNISDPGNLGTIIRTADWFGIKHIYCSNNTVDAYNPKVVQASMGSLARVKVLYTNLNTLFANKPIHIPIFGAVLNGEPITRINSQKNGIILIGNEAHGISNQLLTHVTHKVTIPSYRQDTSNNLESLNASIANAIICYALTAPK